MALYLFQRHTALEFVQNPEEADTVVGDIVDTGETMRQFPGKLIVTLFAKQGSEKHCGIVGTILNTKRHVVLPWEDLDGK